MIRSTPHPREFAPAEAFAAAATFAEAMLAPGALA